MVLTSMLQADLCFLSLVQSAAKEMNCHRVTDCQCRCENFFFTVSADEKCVLWIVLTEDVNAVHIFWAAKATHRSVGVPGRQSTSPIQSNWAAAVALWCWAHLSLSASAAVLYIGAEYTAAFHYVNCHYNCRAGLYTVAPDDLAFLPPQKP